MQLPTTMTALCLTDGGAELRSDVPVPTCAPGEAIVEVEVAGICATDLQLIAGYKGGFRGVLGHEFVGRVVMTGPDHARWMGRRVVGELNIGCGDCELCRRGLAKHCRRRESLGIIGRDGALAEYLALPVANLHAVPDALPVRVAVFTEPLAAALQILEQVHIGPDTRVNVVGDGRLGQLIARALALTGCDLTVLGRHEHKRALLEQASVGRVVASTEDVIEELAQAPADVVVDATGRSSGFASARRLVRPGGTLVLKSTYAESSSPVDLSSLVVDEISVVGSRCGPFPPALRLLATKRVDVAPLVSAEYPLAQALDALEHARRRAAIKVLVQMPAMGAGFAD